MTYGWAILVIAVVLAALYSLGVFNPNTFAPKASADSCEVVRPFGPTTTTDVHLEGTCTNMLPKYAAQFNGKNSEAINTNFEPTGVSDITITAWVNNNGRGNYWQNIAEVSGGNQRSDVTLDIGVTGSGGAPVVRWSDYADAFQNQPNAGTISPNKWYFVVGTWDGSTNKLNIYLDGKLVNSGSGNNTKTTSISIINIGGPYPGMSNFNGSIANVQIYNTSLSANQIIALYQEGIGGDPIELTNLVGWWSLNGNADDYSGNKNNGKEYNIGYSSTWYRTYSAP